VILSFAISPEFREVLDAGLVNTAFQEVVKNGSVEETKQFDIDTAIINFAGTINTTASELNDRFCITNNKR